MHLTLQQLRLFEAVSRRRSFTRAAEELHLTQPAVSIQVKRLEEQVGLPLFEQVGKRLYPTVAGEAMYEASVDILSRIGELKDAVSDLQGTVSGPLRLSVVTTTKYFMPHLLGAFLARYPDVEPKLRFTNRATVLQRLQDNQDDFVVMGQIPEHLALETYHFLDNILVIVAPVGHPLAERKGLTLNDIVGERFLVREQGSGTRLVVDQQLAAHNLSIDPYMELGSAEAIKQGVMAGLGIATLSLHSVALERRAGLIEILDVQGFPLTRPWFAVHPQGKRLSLVARTFLDFILENSTGILEDNANLGVQDNSR
jgi:LysR family transcriptional regulator, low CO2-responsive transcriptional regulator